MYLIIILCYVQLLIILTDATCKEDISYARDKRFFNILISNGTLSAKADVANKAECAFECHKTDRCLSFFYNSDTQRCQMNSVIYLTGSGSEPKPNTMYYREIVECLSDPPTINHSIRKFDVNNIQRTQGTILIYECEDEYSRESVVKCQINGEWSSQKCLRRCPLPPELAHADCSPMRNPVEGQKQYCRCDAGYRKIGERLCQTNGEWTTMVCKRFCPHPPRISESIERFDRNIVSTLEGTQLQYDCISGYTGIPEGLVTCQTNGEWTKMTCVKVCPDPPNFKQTTLVSTEDGPFMAGDFVKYDCDPGFIWKNYNNILTCNADGTWSSPIECQRVLTCKDVHKCNPSYSDADYWLYPPPYGGKRAKIYCHNLNGDIKTYVSLIGLNVMEFPRLVNDECNGEVVRDCIPGGSPGRTEFKKIRVNFQTLVIDQDDYEFTERVGPPKRYGKSADCYTQHPNLYKSSCGIKGRCLADVRGTGNKFGMRPNEVTFFGSDSAGEYDTNDDVSFIDLKCGGWPGGCYYEYMYLIPNQNEELGDGSATTPKCVHD